MSSSPRIVYVTKTPPCPARFGRQIRILNIGRLLRKCGRVTLLLLPKTLADEQLAAARAEFDDVVVMDVVKRLSERPKGRFRRILRSGPGVPAAERQELCDIIREHDVAWFDSLYVASLFALDRFPHSVVDIDDLAHVKLEHEAGSTPKLIARWNLLRCARRVRARELKAAGCFSLLSVCSEADRSYLGRFIDSSKIHVIPNGFDMPAAQPVWHPRREMRLGFIGSLEYAPNVGGIRFFRDEVWPSVKRAVPAARFRIVGRLPADAEFVKHPDFDALGYVEDPADEISTWSAMVVPLRIGGGTRIKIVEAFSRLSPVVSTLVGAYGLDVEPGANILIADEPESFANECIRMLSQPDAAKTIATSAWDLFVKKYTWDAISPEVEKTVQRALEVQ